MNRKYDFYPQSENIEPLNRPYPACRVWSYLGIEITRIVGTTPVGINPHNKTTATRTAKYTKISEASKKRLHKVISKMVNRREATIALFEGGYEAELR